MKKNSSIFKFKSFSPVLGLLALALVPGIAAAQILTFADLVDTLIGILNSLIPLLIAAAIVYVIYTAFMMAKEEGEKREEWQTKLIYGIVAIFVMVSVYGLVNILVYTFDVDNAPLEQPTVGTNNAQLIGLSD
ncbi:MAG: hypothetical protein WC250_00850 [Candidatus Paceibacterota bacterium]|jgi:hypothetical protein